MSAVTQAQALAVLRDLVEEAGGRVDDEVRVELARMLRGLRIATAWQGAVRRDAMSGREVGRAWHLGGDRWNASYHTEVGRWISQGGTLASRSEARAWADERLRAAGWALAPEEGA